MKILNTSKNSNNEKQSSINKSMNKKDNINNPIKITNYYNTNSSDIILNDNPDFYKEFIKLRKEIEDNINLELNNFNIPKNLTNSLITLLNTYQEEIFSNINKNYNQNKLKEIISKKLENILNFTKNQFKIIDLSRKNALNKLNIGFERLNDLINKSLNKNNKDLNLLYQNEKKNKNKVILKPSLSFNHYSGLMKTKKNLGKNKRFLSLIGKLNNSCTNIKTNNNDFSNASLEKEYLNTNPSLTNYSTLINVDSKKFNINEYSFLNKDLGRNSKSLEKEILNLKNSFNSQFSFSKNSEEINFLSNNFIVIFAQKIDEFFQLMNDLQKSIIEKKNNVNELKKNFEILKKKIKSFLDLILKKTNNNNIIIVDNDVKNERLNTNTSIEIKYEKELIKRKLDKSNSSKKEKKTNSIINVFSLKKLIEYENLLKIQNEKINKLESTNEILLEDKNKLNNQIKKLNEELLNINKKVHSKIKNLNLKTNGNNIIELINILFSNNKLYLEEENGINKYYEENIKLKKLFEECIEIINESIKKTSNQYLNMKIPSLFYEINDNEQSENATFKYNKNKIVFNENNIRKAVNVFKNYNILICDKIEKLQNKIKELKDVNDTFKDIIKNTSEKVHDEKELINFDKEFFK